MVGAVVGPVLTPGILPIGVTPVSEAPPTGCTKPNVTTFVPPVVTPVNAAVLVRGVYYIYHPTSPD